VAGLSGCGLDIGYHFPAPKSPAPNRPSPSPSASPSSSVPPIVAQGGGNVIAPGGDPASPGGRAKVTPTRLPDSLPFTELEVPGPVAPTAPDEQWRFRTAAAFTAFLDAQQVPAAGRPTVDFTTQEVIAATVLGQACQGTVVIGVMAGEPMRLEKANYDQGCVNVAGPRPLYAFLAIARTDSAIDGVKEYPAP